MQSQNAESESPPTLFANCSSRLLGILGHYEIGPTPGILRSLRSGAALASSRDSSAISNQQSAISNQQSAIRNQKSEIRNQKSEIGNRKSEIGNRKSEIGRAQFEHCCSKPKDCSSGGGCYAVHGMPLFDFRCADCGHVFEELVLGTQEPACERCGSKAVTKALSAPARIKSVSPACPSKSVKTMGARAARALVTGEGNGCC